ncbi:MAG: sulfur carrier protein ThiS [Planctomycetaceae bacterium]
MQILVNGQPTEIEAGISLAALIQQLQMKPQYVAVECNRVLVPRTKHHSHQLNENDEVEIVTLVGGG